MNMCKKCGTFLAMPGSEYCASCNPSGLSVTQGQVGTAPQQQAQNISAAGISVGQQQSQAGGGTQQQSFKAGGEGGTSPEVMEKLDEIEKGVKSVQGDMKVVLEQLTQIIDNQIANYEGLSQKMDTLNQRRDELNAQISEYESKGEFDKTDELQQQVQQLRDEIKSLFSNMQDSIDVIAENTVKVLENQEITEEFLKKHLSSDWEKIKDHWHDFKDGKTNKKVLIKNVLKIVGVKAAKKLVSFATAKLLG